MCLQNEEKAYFDKLEEENRPQKNVEKHQNKTTPKVISLEAQQHLTFWQLFVSVKVSAMTLFVVRTSLPKDFSAFLSAEKSIACFICFSQKFSLAGNALARVQRVHAPSDLWDITFCTR